MIIMQVALQTYIKGEFNLMMQKIQKFGGAMFTPVLLFAFCGIVVGLGQLFQTPAIMGSIAEQGTLWQRCWYVLQEGGQVTVRQIPLIFVVALPIGLAEKAPARACMEALVLYLTFNYFLSAILGYWADFFHVDFSVVGNGTGITTVANIKTLDTGMIGALVVSAITVWLHDRYFETEMPDWLGVFKGSSFVCILGYFAMLGLSILFAFIWPPIQNAMAKMQVLIINSGSVGVFIYAFLERLLIPTGLHHFIYMPFIYDAAVVTGGSKAEWARILPQVATDSTLLIKQFPAGAYSNFGVTKVFSPVGIAAAFYTTARPERKKEAASLLVPAALTATLAGITEPFEFTFLFIAPLLFVVHAVIAGFANVAMFKLGVAGDFQSGLIRWLANSWLPCMAAHWPLFLKQIGVGLIFSFIWFIVFRTLILKLDLKTPGREIRTDEVKLYSKKEYKAKAAAEGRSKNAVAAESYLELLGGKDNIESVTNCATRLRVSVKDESLVQPAEAFKAAGASGLVTRGKAIQVIVGLSVPLVRTEFEKLLK